jgi:hypothetical protein
MHRCTLLTALLCPALATAADCTLVEKLRKYGIEREQAELAG